MLVWVWVLEWAWVWELELAWESGWELVSAHPRYPLAQRCCPPDHISCGSTFTDDGTQMSINVEMI